MLISPLLVNEAVTSSRIEGTHTTVHEVLAYEAGQTDVTDRHSLDAVC
ncbi:MAG: Fic/DOC family N-terminal domain-containing protein [Coriobacteriales bacterium]